MTEGILIENGLVVTMDKDDNIFENGYVRIEENRIAEVGSGKSAERADQVIDAKGCVIIPGLITAHTHLYGILLRGAPLEIEPPSDFAQILQRVWWPLDENLTKDDAHASALSASADLIRNGSTFFADTYSGPNSIDGSLARIAEATERIGIRSILAFEITERNAPEEALKGLDENLRFANRCVACDSLTSVMMSIHASFTVTDALIEKAVQESKRLNIPLTIHTSEGLVDLYHNLEKYGERTVERLDRLGALSDNTVLAHCVHVNEAELDLIAKSKAAVAHNPMSNMLNAVGTAPIPDMLKRGITVGLGNDGWIFDPFENMRCAYTVHRLARRNPSAIGPYDILKMATIDGAKCYQIDDMIGSLEKDKLADIVILNGDRVPTPLNRHTVIGHLVNSFGGRDVSTVFVNGRMIVESGDILTVHLDEINEVSNRAAEKLWTRMGL